MPIFSGSTMGNSKVISSQGTENSVIPDLEQNPEKSEGVERVAEIGRTNSPREQPDQEDAEPTTKKSLSFKLAFIGLAASLFVFQLDATCLGIALPVSLQINLACVLPQILMSIARPLLVT
jgi:hypothetical protein